MPIPPGHPLREGPEWSFHSGPAFPTVPSIATVNPNAGDLGGGTAVTITGQNFRVLGDGTNPTVTFGGVPATSVVVVNAQTITCVTPAVVSTDLVDVAVTIQGQTGTAFGAFTYTQTTIVSVTPSFGTIAGGIPVTIKGYNFLAGSQVLFGGLPATNVIVVDSNTITCVTPAHATGFVTVSIVEPA